ncbi:MAG: DUF1501 domain-containing protein, partial [Litorimonas sp.]
FSHNDQQSTWMSLGTEGTQTGWGGMFADCTRSSASSPRFAAISASSMDVFLSGERTRPFRMPKKTGELDLKPLTAKWRTSGGHGDAARAKMEAYFLSRASGGGNPFAADVQNARADGIQSQSDFVAAFEGRSLLFTPFPDTKIGAQMQSIANAIHLQSAFGNARQIFYATLGGFDTHDTQAARMPTLLGELSEAVGAFKAAMDEASRWNDVAVFTMSDFGRTLTDNGDGTDHGWGGHHFVLGGGVRGNRLFGDLPELDPASERFTADRPRLIPDVSVEQYAATLGRWFGLEDGDLDEVLPNLTRFESRDLGIFDALAV